MGKHDYSAWRHQPEISGWFDNVLTAICILVMFWWAYDYVEMLAK